MATAKRPMGFFSSASRGALVAFSLFSTSAMAQSADEAMAPDGVMADEIVVTGFRASLSAALDAKRSEAAAIDMILAEDIGKFPDSNLAESMQRIPGVALARGDGGEGRNISVRGLGAQFTRVRINGMEATSQTGGSDIYGAGNAGRSFDFNVFPTEIFSSLAVRKTPSANVEEGSLGATVDLLAPKPLDQRDDFVLTFTGRGVWNELAKKIDPRFSGLVSKSFADGRFGILASGAWQRRNIREVGYSAVDILSANQNGGFCSPIGFAPQNPADNAGKGTTATNCSTGNPRTGSLAAYQTIFDARRADLPNTPGSGAFFPRIPRYVNSAQKQERIAGTLTFQFQPDDVTDISVDLLYSKFNVVRDDTYIGAISFGRSAANNGQPMTSVREVELTPEGSVRRAVFDGVDIRSEGLHADFTSTFQQANLNFKREMTDRLTVAFKVGFNKSKWRDNIRMQHFIDAIDTDGFIIDFKDGATSPDLTFGFDVSNPANFNFAPGLADGTVLGGFSLQGKPAGRYSDGMMGELDFSWRLSDAFTLQVGSQFRRTEYGGFETRYWTADTLMRALPPGVTLASLTKQMEGVDKLWGYGAPQSWATLDWEKLADTFNLFDSRTCIRCGEQDQRVLEEITSAYAMGSFDFTDQLGFGLRGDIGVRYVHTDQSSSGNIVRSNAASPTGVVGVFNRASRSYSDWLPSANIVVEPVENFLIRISGAKVMARADLGVLPPTSGVNAVTRNGNVNNPDIDPIRANTFDIAAEWYFRPGALLSVAFFYKDIKTYIQSVSSQIPFNELGLPNELLDGSNTLPTELFTISRPTNTPGGPLKGIELNAQIPFDFLQASFIRNFGVLANYTHVTSQIDYCLVSVGGNCTVVTNNDLIGLSKDTASGTLYYEDRKFSIRGTVNYRAPFIRGIPASPGTDLQGNASTVYVDAAASFNINDRIRLTLEAQNLTDEQNRLYLDSTRQDTLFETRVGRTVTAGVNVRF